MKIYDLKREGWNFIDKNVEDLVRFCSDIVGFPSENPPGDMSDIAGFIREYLEEKSVELEWFELKKGQVSLVATMGSGRPSLILYGHMDVVPAGDVNSWDFPPFSGEVKGDRIVGRGAADMKGGLSALIYAFLAFLGFEDDFPGKLTLVIVPDEESGGIDGVSSSCWLLDSKKVSGDACIMGEPTSMRYIGIGDKGDSWFKIVAKGRSAHGSLPVLGDNAIIKMFRALCLIEERLSKCDFKTSEILPDINRFKRVIEEQAEEFGLESKSRELSSLLDHCAVNIGTVSGGSWVNTVPSECVSEVAVTIPLGTTPLQIKDMIESILKEAGLWDDVSCELYLGTNPTYTSRDHKLCKALSKNVRDLIGIEPKFLFSLGTSDAVFYRERGVATVHFGPGSMKMAHAFNEFVYIKDLVNAAKIYVSTIIDYLFDRLRDGKDV